MSERAGIKFRAWNMVTKTMFYNIQMGIGAPHGNPPFADYLCNYRMMIMQYTGWKDKNGKEVYEGDIVQIHDHHGVVVWDDVTDGWRIRVRDTFNLRDVDMVVIGHIYEQEQAKLLEDFRIEIQQATLASPSLPGMREDEG